MKLVPKEAQIRALLQEGEAFALMQRIFKRKKISAIEYAQVFTVKREEVLAYVREHGFPTGSCHNRPHQGDGLYMHEEDGEYVVYYQERGSRWPVLRHKTRPEAQAAVVDQLLACSGVTLGAPVVPGALEKLDELLQRSDPDSQEWADGLGAALAGERLAELSQQEWQALQDLSSNRGRRWRGCLASVLTPKLGDAAIALLFRLSADPEIEVAFSALWNVAFYCGVNASSRGLFLDPRILDPSFLKAAQQTSGLVESIRMVRARCHPGFQQRFDLLLEVLSRDT